MAFKKYLLCFIFSFVGLFPLQASVVQVESFKQIESTLESLDSNALVVIDVDEVMLTDQDLILKPMGDPLKFQIFNEYYIAAKSEREEEEVSKTLSLSLLLSQKTLLEEDLPQMITSLQKRKIKVIALTSCPTKSFGVIENLEKWRLNHMREFGIHLERSFPCLKRFLIEGLASQNIPMPIFNRGVLFTEGFSKADVLASFLKKVEMKPSRVVFIDDLSRNLQQMDTKLIQMKIPHSGFQYQGQQTELPPNEKLARFQFEYLFKYKKWLSDEEAKALL